jgi:hypothetical protein
MVYSLQGGAYRVKAANVASAKAQLAWCIANAIHPNDLPNYGVEMVTASEDEGETIGYA